MNGPLSGIVAAVVTPFDDRGNLDVASWRKLLGYIADNGIHGVYVAGTTGESPFLDAREREELSAVAVEVLGPPGVKVATHTGSTTTQSTVELSVLCAATDCDALAVVSPQYYTYPPDLIAGHFAAACAAVPQTPVYLYNLPGYTGNSFGPDLVLELQTTQANLVGVKDSSKDFSITDSFIAAGIDTLSGTDGQIVPTLVAGAVGSVSAVACCEPELVRSAWDAFSAHDLPAMRRSHRAIVEARSILKAGPPLLGYKQHLVERGIISSPRLRAPLGS